MYIEPSSSSITSIAGATSAASQKQTASADPLSGFGSQDFMLLLLTQLRNQNPLEPLKNEEFMSQITQLNSLNELQSIDATMKNLSNSSVLSSAAGLIGKKVKLVSGESDIVTGIVVDSDQVMLQIGTLQVPLSDVVSVSAPDNKEVV
jgi:flagellar basal-body rod modification protein FlgD